jgi:hypothetical protein
MRSSAAVATAIGAEFETIGVEPVGRYDSPVGIAFLVKTPEPVTLPPGTLTTSGSGEGTASSIEPSVVPLGPASYFYVILNGDFSAPVFLIVPDALAEHDTLAPPTP